MLDNTPNQPKRKEFKKFLYKHSPIKAINIDTEEVKYFKSQAEAARCLNLHQPNINHVLSGFYGRTGRYTFKYVTRSEYIEQCNKGK